MAKKLQPLNVFRLKRRDERITIHDYFVILKGLPNDANGNKRYEALVFAPNDPVEGTPLEQPYAHRVRFTGHCMPEKDEAEWALDYLLKTQR